MEWQDNMLCCLCRSKIDESNFAIITIDEGIYKYTGKICFNCKLELQLEPIENSSVFTQKKPKESVPLDFDPDDYPL